MKISKRNRAAQLIVILCLKELLLQEEDLILGLVLAMTNPLKSQPMEKSQVLRKNQRKKRDHSLSEIIKERQKDQQQKHAKKYLQNQKA